MSLVMLSLLAATSASAPTRWADADLRKLRHFADCLVAVGGRDVRNYAASAPQSEEEHRLGQKLASAHSGCLQKRGINFIGGDVVHGMVSEAMILRDDTILDNIARRPVEPATRPPVGLGRSAFLSRYATCLLGSAPRQSAAVMRAPISSAQERTEVLAFGDMLSACMPSDAAYHLNSTEIRVNLATAIYRASIASVSAT